MTAAPKKGIMSKYTVTVIRTAYASRDIEVEAADAVEAEIKAIDMAGNFSFSEKGAEYSSEGVTQHE